MSYARSFARFWWNFIIGDDWRLAAGLAVALGVTWVLAHDDLNAWWLLPPAVALLLARSLWRATRESARPKVARRSGIQRKFRRLPQR